MLHITNGDSTESLIRRSGVSGDVLPWRDALYEGPVPGNFPLEKLSETRARFLASCGWGEQEAIRRNFQDRDHALAQAAGRDEVVLWFEHDLYDQLQLAQILDWFYRGAPARLSLICIGSFPGIERFFGLGQLNPEQIASLFPLRQPVADSQLKLGAKAWRCFRSPDPTAIELFLHEDLSALPFLKAALLRHLEQFPSAANGLSRTERQILEIVASGVTGREAIFHADQHREERPFMGDATLYMHIDRLAQGRAPLLALGESGYELTGNGRSVLEGRADYVRLNGIDRWYGGVHLHGEEAKWRWDGRKLVEHARAAVP